MKEYNINSDEDEEPFMLPRTEAFHKSRKKKSKKDDHYTDEDIAELLFARVLLCLVFIVPPALIGCYLISFCAFMFSVLLFCAMIFGSE